MIYRGKHLFCQTCFCQTIFVALVTENWFMVFNIVASQRILMKVSPIPLRGINCGTSQFQIHIMFKRLVSAHLFSFPQQALHKEF